MRYRVKQMGQVGFMNVKKTSKDPSQPAPSYQPMSSPHGQTLPVTAHVPPSHCRLRYHFPDPKHLSDLKRLILQTEHPASTPVQRPQAEFKDQFSSTSQHRHHSKTFHNGLNHVTKSLS